MIWPILLLPLVPTILRFLLACHISLINLRKVDDYAILPFSPNDLSIADVVLVVCIFIGRSIKRTLGCGSTNTPTSSSSEKQHEVVSSPRTSSQKNDKDTLLRLQRLELAMPLYIRSSDLDQYIKTISPSPSSTSSSQTQSTQKQPTIDILTTNPTHLTLFLSAISEPALLLLLARNNCPIEPLGAVNARNNFQLLRPDLCKSIIHEAELTPPKTQQNPSPKPPDQKLETSVLASLPPSIRPVKRGTEIDITVSIYTRLKQSQTQEWGPNIEAFRQIFTILQFTSSPTSISRTTNSTTTTATKSDHLPPTATSPTSDNPPVLATYLHLPPSSPLQWAKLTKDYNPIHISSFAARAFGFKGVIAHGNHVVAKALAATPSTAFDSSFSRNQLVVAEEERGDDERAIFMDVSFKRPIVVPCELGVRVLENEELDKKRGMKMEIFKGEKVYIEIEIGSLSSTV